MKPAAITLAVLMVVAQPFRARSEIDAAPGASQAAPTYAKDIAPLIADRCVMCHHAGGSAPFALATYADVKRRAASIASVTTKRYMPPWKADPADGPFVGQHPLTDAEIALLQQWASDGAPEGDPRDVPRDHV